MARCSRSVMVFAFVTGGIDLVVKAVVATKSGRESVCVETRYAEVFR